MATFRLLNEILIGREDPVKFNSDPNRFDSWTYWSRRSYLPSGIRAKDLSLQILKQIVEICDQNHIQLVIAALPNMGQVYAPALLTEDMDYGLPQKYVEEFSKTYSVPYFDLLPPLRNYVQQTHRNIYMGVDVHFNDEGHGLAGRLLFDDFMQLLSEQHVPVFLRETP